MKDGGECQRANYQRNPDMKVPRLPDRRQCCGCGACRASCPKGAIAMLPDEEGFLQPVVDVAKCVNCGKCEAVCPVRKDVKSICPIECYAAKTKDKVLLEGSSSGGVFSELALWVLNRGGCVFGCVLNDCVAMHVKTEDAEGLRRMRGSKYVQSDLRDTYCECRDELQKGRLVLFSGVPCQIAGLRSFLGREYENLLALGVICHGVASPAVLRRYLDDEEHAWHAKVRDVRFRDKLSMRGTISMVLSFVGRRDKVYKDSFGGNPYMRAYLGSYSYRQSCFSCASRSGRSGADIVIGDFWGVGDVLPEVEFYDGISSVVIYTEKGRSVFGQLPIEHRIVQYADIVRSNQNLERDSERPVAADTFMKEFRSCKSIGSLMKRIEPEAFSARFWRFVMIQERRVKNLLGLR